MPDSRLYSELSSYYDLMCADIDYVSQCEAALRVHKVFGAGGQEYLDLGCGTGPHVAQFLEFGYQATGLDLNAPMLAQAQARCPAAEFSLQNMCDFRFAKSFDLITCFLYSIHYCYPTHNLLSAFHCVYNALNEGGVFCFDAVNKNTIANDAGVKHSVEHNGDLVEFQSRWFYPGNGDLLQLHLTIAHTQNQQQQTWHDQHAMCAVDIAFLQDQLAQIGFAVTVLERDFERLLPWGGDSGNVLVVCVKTAAAELP